MKIFSVLINLIASIGFCFFPFYIAAYSMLVFKIEPIAEFAIFIFLSVAVTIIFAPILTWQMTKRRFLKYPVYLCVVIFISLFCFDKWLLFQVLECLQKSLR